MSEPEAIVPSGIPQFTGDLDSLDHDTALLSTEAGAFRDAGAGIHSHFQGVAAFYKAPEAEQLFATTAPVAVKTATFAGQLERVSGALSAYSQEVRPLAKKLEDLQRQAFAFTASIAGDDHWRRDEKKRDRNDGLKDEVQATLQAFYEAEIACHNKITALVGGSTLVLGNHGDKKFVRFGTVEYGATADDLGR
ncbi:protein phosphatase, partial [Streptomyces violascens]